MEDSPIPVRHWVFAFWAASASKKGVSSLQIRRQTGVSYKSALFMMHRIRWAMNHGASTTPLTGIVEVDETYIGGKPRHRRKSVGRQSWGGLRKFVPGPNPQRPKARVIAMVARDGEVRTFAPTEVHGRNLRRMVEAHVCRTARIHTDEYRAYRGLRRSFAAHEKVRHTEREYVRGDVTTNTVESFFAILKRGIIGTFHNVSKKHLHRYCSEFEFRWNTRDLDDGGRLVALIQRGEGARLTYAEQVG